MEYRVALVQNNTIPGEIVVSMGNRRNRIDNFLDQQNKYEGTLELGCQIYMYTNCSDRSIVVESRDTGDQ